jgi:predicted flap endonuclease-1-like 5' DNA nuclease
MGRLFVFLIGFLMGLWFGQRVRTTQPPARPEQPPSPAPAAPRIDPLHEITGIGQTFEKALNKLGIYTFADLAAQQPELLAQRLDARITADRIRRDRWIEQAQQKINQSQ